MFLCHLADVKEFRKDFEQNGPMRPGMTPVDAAEALKKYQRYFETYERKWNTYSEGEEMFALYITEYPELEQTKKELGLLEKLYSLYTETSTTITGYADILWTDVVANIEGMNEESESSRHAAKQCQRRYATGTHTRSSNEKLIIFWRCSLC